MTATIEDGLRLFRNRIRTEQNDAIDVAAVDKPGSVLNVVAAGAAELFVEADARSSARWAAHMISTARDEDLERLIAERTWGRITRRGASAAALVLRLERDGVAGFSVPAGTEVVVGSQVYTLDRNVVFPANDKGPKTAYFTASALGLVGNQPTSGATKAFNQPGVLFDPTLRLLDGSPDASSNDNHATGGAERERDDELRARFAAFDAGLDRNEQFLTASALAVPGVAFASGFEHLALSGIPTGELTLYVADVNGRANAALLERVRAAMRGFRLLGQDVRLFGAQPTLVDIDLHFAILTGVDQASVQAAVRAAVVAYVGSLKPGATLARAGLSAAVQSVPAVVLEQSYPFGIVTPSADVAPSSSATLFRTTSDRVTFS